MTQNVGVWIDHTKAVIVMASTAHPEATTLESDLGSHPRYSGHGGEGAYEAQNREHLDRYYDAVIGQLGQPTALLICGPGEAKLQLRERLVHVKSLSGTVVHIESTDKLTDAQIVEKVRQHFEPTP